MLNLPYFFLLLWVFYDGVKRKTASIHVYLCFLFAILYVFSALSYVLKQWPFHGPCHLASLSDGISLGSAPGDVVGIEKSMTISSSFSLCFGTCLSGRGCIPLCLQLIQLAPPPRLWVPLGSGTLLLWSLALRVVKASSCCSAPGILIFFCQFP